MSILDAILILVLLIGVFTGFKKGVIKEAVSLIGLVLAFVLAFGYKNILATYMYERLPFFSFDWLFDGISSINIILYEMIAFILIFAVLLIIVKIITAITGLIEKILSSTVILGIPSKILGAALGLLESWVLVFIFAYFISQPFISYSLLDNSEVAKFVVDKTPYVSSIADKYMDAFEEIYSIRSKFDSEEGDELNRQVIDILLKYNITEPESIDILIERGKIDDDGMDEILDKYRTEG